MKIALIRQKFASHGGAENFTRQLVDRLAEAGHEVHILAHKWTGEIDPKIKFHPIPVLKLNSWTRSLSFACFADRAVRLGKFDIVQSHERTWNQDVYRAGDGCHREWLEQRKKYLPTWKSRWVDCSPFHQLMLRIERRIFTSGNYKKIIANSEMVRRNIQKHYHLPDEDIEVIPNGVDLEKFHPRNREGIGRQIRAKLGVPEKTRLFLFVGSGFERKGLRFLLQSLGHLPRGDWKLLVVGKGNWSHYRRWAPPEVQDRLIYQPPVEDIESYYAAADVFVLPALYDPFSNANLEAMATGIPVITTQYCGAGDIVQPGREGQVIKKPDDLKEIAGAMEVFLDKEAGEEMGAQARSLAETFSWKRTMEAMVRLYQNILKASRDT